MIRNSISGESRALQSAYSLMCSASSRRWIDSRVNGTASVMKPGLHHRRSEEHTSELQSLMRISYAVFCLQKTNTPRVKHAQPGRRQKCAEQRSESDKTTTIVTQHRYK